MDLDPLERLMAERACERLIADYTHCLDLGDPADAAALFTDDAVWEIPGVMRVEGRAAISETMRHRFVIAGRTARHVTTNVAIDVVSPDEAVGTCYLVNFRYDDPTESASGPSPMDDPKYVGDYHDRFVRTPEGWRFAHRRVHLAFERP